MHFTDASIGLLGAFAIVGAGLPVALGAAMASKRLGEKRVAVSFCGDGATNIGTFHETLNMASVWKAPVVFIVENNLYGEYTPLRHTTPLDHLAERAASYAMPGIVVDGQRIELVHEEVTTALERARAGEGPTLIEAKTYRYSGHSRTDPAKYRPPGELDEWKQRDPIDLLGETLMTEGHLSEHGAASIRKEAQDQVDRIADEAASGPIVTIEEMKGYVYAD